MHHADIVTANIIQIPLLDHVEDGELVFSQALVPFLYPEKENNT